MRRAGQSYEGGSWTERGTSGQGRHFARIKLFHPNEAALLEENYRFSPLAVRKTQYNVLGGFVPEKVLQELVCVCVRVSLSIYCHSDNELTTYCCTVNNNNNSNIFSYKISGNTSFVSDSRA